MFIQCSDCDYKYLINSAALKPDGRMVECANWNHRWFQVPLKEEGALSSSVPKATHEKLFEKEEEIQNNETNPPSKEIKNFLDSIEGKNDLLVKPEQAVNVTKIAEAALLSSKKGTPIYLDLRWTERC